MAKGRRPKPTAVKLVSSARKPSKKHTDTEPVPSLGIPQPPKHLDAGAKAEWKRVTRDLFAAGLLAYIDRAALAAYCQAWSTWETAQLVIAQIAKQEPLYKGLIVTSSTGALKANPAVTQAKDAQAAILRFAIEFGMTPAARSRMHVHAPKIPNENDSDQDAPIDEFAKYY